MQRCPHCHHALEDGLLPICWHCGRETLVESNDPVPVKPKADASAEKLPEAPLAFGFDQLDGNIELEPEVVTPTIAPPPEMPVATPSPAAHVAPPAPKLRVPDWKLNLRVPDWKRYRVPILAVAGLGAVALALSVMGRPSASTDAASTATPAPAPPSTVPSTTAPVPPAPAAPAPTTPTPSTPAPTAPAPAAPAQAAPVAPATPPSDVSHVPIEEAPGWIIPRRAGYASDGSRLLTLQVAALRDVQVSREYIRPVLAVRCLSRRTEVFVSLGTSAQIEAGDTNRVTVQLDSQTPSAQQWLRTHTYQELFAPDGLALARQLAAASLMRFTFTPFNSRPVVAEFNVKGFDEHVAMVARTCGWATPERTNARKR
jgi:hypothetical protein